MSANAVRLRLVLLAALVGALAYFFFFNQSLRLDESQSLWQTGRSAADILTIVAQDVHVPLYHEILHFWRIVVGDTVEYARLLSLLFYIASIPALYALGRLASALQVELGEHMADVVLDRLRRDEEPRCDLPVGQAFREQGEDLVLTSGELAERIVASSYRLDPPLPEQ